MASTSGWFFLRSMRVHYVDHSFCQFRRRSFDISIIGPKSANTRSRRKRQRYRGRDCKLINKFTFVVRFSHLMSKLLLHVTQKIILKKFRKIYIKVSNYFKNSFISLFLSISLFSSIIKKVFTFLIRLFVSSSS